MCRVPTTIMHLTHECTVTQKLRSDTNRKIRTLLYKEKIPISSPLREKFCLHPKDDTQIHEMGFIPKQQYHSLNRPQQKIVDRYHHIYLEQMHAIWQCLWAKKGEFHEERPNNPPKLQEDPPPPPDNWDTRWTKEETAEIEMSEPKTRHHRKRKPESGEEHNKNRCGNERWFPEDPPLLLEDDVPAKDEFETITEEPIPRKPHRKTPDKAKRKTKVSETLDLNPKAKQFKIEHPDFALGRKKKRVVGFF